jgi:hypothetical protein
MEAKMGKINFRKIILTLGLFFLFVFIYPQLAQTAKWAETPSGLDLIITSVLTQFQDSSIIFTILGNNFDNGDIPLLSRLVIMNLLLFHVFKMKSLQNYL